MSASELAPKRSRIWIPVFWAQLAAFTIMIGIVVFGSAMGRWMRVIFLPWMGVCFVLGLILLILALRARPTGALRWFLLLAAASPAGFAVASVLHNVFYALATLVPERSILWYALNGLEVIFFLIAVPLCPLSWIVGSVGVGVTLIKGGKPATPQG